MFKRLFTTSALLASLTLPGLTAPGVQVLIDQQPQSFDQPPVMRDGRVLVPLRGIFESLGADVVYLPSSRAIKATRGQTQVELSLGSQNAMVNGRSVYLDVPATSYGGRTMVPLRFISEAMGAGVDWSSATRTVSITSPTTSMNIQDDPPPVNTPAARIKIQSVVHSSNGVLYPGDQLQVTMTGTPNGRAVFDVLGAIDGVPMEEVGPGRYQGSVTIPNTLSISEGSLVGRLEANGQSSQMEASRKVRFGSGQANPGTPNPGNASVLLPQPSSTIAQTRPNIEAQFARPVRPGSIRMLVDGQDVTGRAVVLPRKVTFRPVSQLAGGQHHVVVRAIDNQGRAVQDHWSFNVRANAGPSGNNSIQLLNLRDGMTVNRVFNVQGQTRPFSSVHILGQSSQDLVPGIIGVRGRDIEARGMADANGRFNLRMDASALPSNTILETRIDSTDSNGQAQNPVHLRLTIR